MHINFYGSHIDCGIVIPTYVYRIIAKSKQKSNINLDILGETLLELLDVNALLEIDKLVKLLGIPYKYKKLVVNEINELMDLGLLEINEENIITKVCKVEKSQFEVFYLIYDKVNKNFLECIIPKAEFEQRYLDRSDFDKSKGFFIKENGKGNLAKKYTICDEISKLINKSNKISVEEIDEDDYDNAPEFIRPYYHIALEEVENIDNPMEADFIFKATVGKDGEIQYQSPFSLDYNSVYINNYIKNKVDEKVVKRLLQIDYFRDLDQCKNKSEIYINKYKKFDQDKQRIEYIERISFYREVLSVPGEVYKNFALVISDIDKLVKSVLKELISKYGVISHERKNITIKAFCDLEEINDIKVIDTIINQRIKMISKDKELIKSIGESSIVSYLKCIYISNYLTSSKYEQKVFEVFSSNRRIIEFLNSIWLYRNNTSHNIEKQKHYDSDYDMEIMVQDRLEEVIEELMEEILYFAQAIKEI